MREDKAEIPKSGPINKCVSPVQHDNWKTCSSDNIKYSSLFSVITMVKLSPCALQVTYFKIPDSNFEFSVKFSHE